MCDYCDNEGVIEMDNNGPIFDCPICGNADKRPQLGHWAPGNYEHKCYLCGKTFLGDKRAGTCAPCEYKDNYKAQCK
jgi:hypothetical protein